MIRHTLCFALAFAAGVSTVACGPDTTQGDACTSRLPGDVVISEFLADPDGTDTGKEYIELYNASGKDVDLKGLTLVASDLSATTEKKHTFRSQVIPAGGYLAVGDARTDPKPSWMGYSYGTDLGALRQTAGAISVRCGTRVIDEVKYNNGGKAAHSRELNGALVPDSAINDLEQNFCDATASFDGTNFGTPGAANSVCGAVGGGTCIDAVSGEPRTIVSPAEGELVFTEFLADPAAVGDDVGEWVELFAPTRTVDLNGLELQSGTSKTTFTSDNCLTIGVGSYGVLAKSEDPAVNGGLSFVTAKMTASLANSNGTLSLLAGNTLIDSITWASTKSGTATQLSPDTLSAVANDDPLNFCAASKVYGSAMDKGTPGEANSTCPVTAPPGECIDPDTGLSRPVEKPAAGALAISEWMADPSSVGDTAGEWFEVTALQPFDFNDLQIQVGAGTPVAITSGNCLHLEPGQQALFAHKTDPTANGGLPFVTATFSAALVNSNGSVAIKDGTTTLDQVTWASSKSGIATQVNPASIDPVANDDAANFCDATAGYGTGTDLGTPGAPNSPCGGAVSSKCNDNGTMRDIVAPASGQLVITEFMADPSAVADSAGEWFEVMATADVDLNGVQVANEGTGNSTIQGTDCIHVPANTYAVLARNADAAVNGGLPSVAGTFSFGLTNSGTSTAPRAIILRSGAGEIDRVQYTASTPGVSTQLDAGKLDAVANDDAANFCATATGTTYGSGDRGTPGAANLACQ